MTGLSDEVHEKLEKIFIDSWNKALGNASDQEPSFQGRKRTWDPWSRTAIANERRLSGPGIQGRELGLDAPDE